MQVHFSKIQSSGSDHVVVGGLLPSRPVSDAVLQSLAKAMCDRAGPVGADGLVCIADTVGDTTAVRIFTPDGNEPDLCVNGLLCAARYLSDRRALGPVLNQRGHPRRIQAAADSRFPSRGFRIAGIGAASSASPSNKGDTDGWLSRRVRARADFGIHYVDTGTPHAVLFVDSIDESALDVLGRAANQERSLFPNGINISLCRVLSRSRIFVRTFERGGAGLSLSCASATIASVHAGLVAGALDLATKSLEAITLGGLALVERKADGEAVDYSYSADVSRAFDASTLVTGAVVGPVVTGEAYVSEILAYGQYREDQLNAIGARSFVSGTSYV